MKALIVCDGTVQSKMALGFGLDRIKAEGGSAVVLNIFNDTMYIDYGAGFAAIDRARAENAARFAEAKKMVAESGVSSVKMVTVEGDPETVILQFADSTDTEVLLVPARYSAVANGTDHLVILFPENKAKAAHNIREMHAAA